MQTLWIRWICLCQPGSWKKTKTTLFFLNKVYHNEVLPKFLITPILLKRSYYKRGWGSLTPFSQWNGVLSWRNPFLILQPSASSSVFPSSPLHQVCLLADLACWTSPPQQRETALAVCWVRWFSSASGQKVHMVPGKQLELVVWGEG